MLPKRCGSSSSAMIDAGEPSAPTCWRESLTTSLRSRRPRAAYWDRLLGARRLLRSAKLASVLARGRAIRSLVFATELRGAVIADGVAHRRDVLGSREQPRARFLQADLLQVLQRAHQGHRAEVAVE